MPQVDDHSYHTIRRGRGRESRNCTNIPKLIPVRPNVFQLYRVLLKLNRKKLEKFRKLHIGQVN